MEKNTKPKVGTKPSSATSAKPKTTSAKATSSTTAKASASKSSPNTKTTVAKPATSTKATPAKPSNNKASSASAVASKSTPANTSTASKQAQTKAVTSGKAVAPAQKSATQSSSKSTTQKADSKQSAKKEKKERTFLNTKEKKQNAAVLTLAITFIIVALVGIVLSAVNFKKHGDGGDELNPGGIVIPVPDRGQYNVSTGLKPTDPYESVSLGTETFYDNDDILDYSYDIFDTKSTTMVGYSGRVIGEVERNVPNNTRDEGLGVYPKYAYTLSTVIGSGKDQVAARNALIAESNYFCATGTHNNSGNGGSYVWMDQDGYLYKGTTALPQPALDRNDKHRRLYKHTASIGMYMGDVADDEPGIIKEVTLRPRGYNSYSVTGVYAPAGEIIKIQLSEEDMNATGGITVHIGQALYNGQANNIWTEKGQMQRFPVILNTMNVNKNTATLENGVYTAYVGSFVGGPLYIRNTRATFTATISGGVAYSHFILGSTTKEEFEAYKNSSAPYFDLEVWNYGVLHSGPKTCVRNFSYEDLYKAAVLWEKVSSVTTTGSSQGVVFLYDPFVAAGAAVAFPGRSSVNCPTGWMTNALNYNGLVTSGGWGNFHEYHHNFQGYGVGNGGEVTNNGMNLVSYALFTKISSARGISNYGSQGLGGWNSYTSATWALNEVLKIPQGGTPSNGKQGLALYATLLHNFGADNYIQSKVRQQIKSYGQSYSGYLRAWQDITHNDMTYFFKDILQGIDQANADKWQAEAVGYPMFVPVSSVYQTGRSYMYDGEKKYFQTMQPYVIPYGQDFVIDLTKYTVNPGGQYQSGSVVLPEGFSYTITNITQPTSGTVETIDGYHLKFKPGNQAMSGEIKVTLAITKDDHAFDVADIDLVLQFEQSHETNKMTLERTTYTYTAETMYSDAVEAYESNYQGYENVVSADHSNPTQNCNTDIWLYPNTDQMHEQHPNAPESHFVHDNQVIELKGKLYFNEAGKHRIYLRGRKNCAVYYSTDNGATYQLGAKVTNGSGSAFYPSNAETYFDVTIEEGGGWIYYKSILIVQSTPVVSYIGLGTTKWIEPMFTIINKYYDKDGNEVSEEEAVRTETHYYDYQGNEVTEEEANNAELIPPAANARPAYVNAYRNDYEFPENSGFVTDYFYTRKYSYTYTEPEKVLTPTQTCISSNYQPWDSSDTHKIENLFDNDDSTYIHSNRNVISEANPFEVTVNLSQSITANRLTFFGSSISSNYATYMPKDYKIWVSSNGSDWTLVCEKTNAPYSNLKSVANFDSYHTFNYYKVKVTSTHARNNLGYICLNKIELASIFSLTNGNQITPDNEMFTYSGTWTGKQTQSSFGHIYVGNSGATMSFTFTGTRLALLSSSSYGRNFEVTIDGRVVNSIELKQDNNPFSASYISSELTSGTHNVTVKCLGTANIDSVVIY